MKIFNLLLIFMLCVIIPESHEKIKKNNGKSTQKQISNSTLEESEKTQRKINESKTDTNITKLENRNSKKVIGKSKGKVKKPVGKSPLKDKKHIYKSAPKKNQGKSSKKKLRTKSINATKNQQIAKSASKKLHQPKQNRLSKSRAKKNVSKSPKKSKSKKNLSKSNLRSKLPNKSKPQGVIITESALLPSLASVTYIGIHICSGTILTNRFILTVAHCAYDGLHEVLPKENMKVVLGKTSAQNGTIYDVQGLIIHENFDNVTYANDIALIRTLKTIVFGKNVALMVLRGKAVLDKKFNDNATVSWFGFPPSEMNSIDETFLIANVRSIPIDVCRKTFVSVSLRHICMSSVATDGNCNEDSGGPLVIGSYGRIEQIGILSFSINCGINKPEVYTRISWYFEWIKKVLERVK